MEILRTPDEHFENVPDFPWEPVYREWEGMRLAHIDEGKKVMDKVIQELIEVGKVEAPPMNQGKRMICTLMPK